MSCKYKFLNPDGLYFITFSVVRWADVFTRDRYRMIMLDSFRYCQKEKGLVIHAYVIMTNHLHMIVSKKGRHLLGDIMRDMKKFIADKIINTIKNNPVESRKSWMIEIFKKEGQKNSNNKIYQFWQQDNHPIELTSNKMMEQKLDYIHNNPVKQGFVKKAEDYPWSSISDYLGEPGFIEIELIE